MSGACTHCRGETVSVAVFSGDGSVHVRHWHLPPGAAALFTAHLGAPCAEALVTPEAASTLRGHAATTPGLVIRQEHP